jgi:CheY-like chemotaxis protein
MNSERCKLLVVDDDLTLRESLCMLFAQMGHTVASAWDGFSALAAMRLDEPDVLVSDLQMPGMSGYELLSVVRRRFPLVRVIAMSGAFDGSLVPPGIAADGYYAKGRGVRIMLELLDRLVDGKARLERPERERIEYAPVPVWVASNGRDHSGDAYVLIGCPECMRSFKQLLGPEAQRPATKVQYAVCAYCTTAFSYAVAQAQSEHPAALLHQKETTELTISLSLAEMRKGQRARMAEAQ